MAETYRSLKDIKEDLRKGEDKYLYIEIMQVV